MTANSPEVSRDGLVLVDKPVGWTSHDVVARMRRLAGTRKVGHAGTLDPMATGLLVLGVNRATRLLTYLVGADKTYTATVRLGQETITDDAEGEVTRARGTGDPGDLTTRVASAVADLTGAIQQVPSAVSAIKVDGQRSYARVRAGQDVALPARPITVHSFDICATRPARTADGIPLLDVDVRVACSSGTYVRALARDLGEALGTGGHLTVLRRHRVGPFDVAAAHTLQQHADQLELLSVTEVLRAAFSARELDADEARAVRYGQKLSPSGRDEVVAAFDPAGRGIALLTDQDGRARPVLVLHPA